MADENPPAGDLPTPDEARSDDTGQPEGTTEPGDTGVGTALSRGRRIGLIVGSVAFVAGILFAGFTVFATSGGGPKDTAEDFLASLEAEDVLGAGESLLPGERRVVLEPLLAEVEEAQRLGILSDVDLNAVQGLDLEFIDLSYVVEALADDLAWVAISGNGTAGLRAEELPLGPLVVRYLPDSWAEDLPSNVEEETALGEGFGLALVKQDGDWYVSLLHTIAEAARRDAGAAFPETQPFGEPAGAATPTEAMEQLVLAVANIDLRGLVSVLDPDETAAFRRYAALFLDDWDAGVADFRSEMDAAGFTYSVDEVVAGSAQRGEDTVAWIEDIPKLSMALEVPDLGEVISVERDGECWKVRVDETLLQQLQVALLLPGIDYSQFTGEDCLSDAFGDELAADPLSPDLFADAEDLVFELPVAGPLLERWSESFGSLEAAGASAVQFHLEEHDGRWYVSLSGTLHRWVTAFTSTLDESLLAEVGDDIRQAAEDPDAFEQRFMEFLVELEERGLLDPFTAAILGQSFPIGEPTDAPFVFGPEILAPYAGIPTVMLVTEFDVDNVVAQIEELYGAGVVVEVIAGPDLHAIFVDAFGTAATGGLAPESFLWGLRAAPLDIDSLVEIFNWPEIVDLFPATDLGLTTELIPPGVELIEITDRSHTDDPVDYPHDPPAGGPHNPVWLNCGFYAEPVPNENAVHSLEHGVVWITFQPGLPADDIGEIRRLAELPEVIASPYPGLDSPVVATAWGAQMRFTSASSPDLEQFAIALRDVTAPEPSAGCEGGVGDPD